MKALNLFLWTTLWSIVILVVPCGTSQAQDASAQHHVSVCFQEIALIEVVGSPSYEVDLASIIPNLELNPGQELELIPLPESVVWLNYTTMKDPKTDAPISILAHTLTEVPPGFELLVYARNPVESGGGAKGESVAVEGVPLQTEHLTLIENIGNSYTGTGPGSGIEVSFALKRIDPNADFYDCDGMEIFVEYEIKSF